MRTHGFGPSSGRSFDMQKTGQTQAADKTKAAVTEGTVKGGGGGCHGGGGTATQSADTFEGRGIFGGQGAVAPPASGESPFTLTNTPQTAESTDANSIVSDADIQKATGGNQALAATLKKVASDPEGAKVLRDALNKGTTYTIKPLDGGTAGLTHLASNKAPYVEIDDNATGNISVLAHESAHAAYPDMDHTDVYNLGYRISDNLGVKEPRVPGYENIQ
jgi:hypothetical protein